MQGSFLIAGLVDAAFGWRAAFIAAGIGPLLSICALGLLPAPCAPRSFAKRSPPFRALLRNRALVDYVAAFAGNTWEVFAVRVWFAAYLAWLLRLPGNHISLPPLGMVSGLASLAGVPVSMVMAEIAARRGRRPVVIGICLVSVATCLALAATAGGSIGIVLPLLVLVQITSLPTWVRWPGARLPPPIRHNAGPRSRFTRSPGSQPAFSRRSRSGSC